MTKLRRAPLHRLLALTAAFHIFLLLNPASGVSAVERNAKWIVFAPASSGEKSFPRTVAAILEAEPEWRAVVVYAPPLPPTKTVHERATLLAPDDGELAQFKTKTGTTDSTAPHVRRMLGYLFAIKYGAKFIFDGDVKAVHTPRALDKLTAPAGSYTFFDQPINPYAYYGQPALWPHGLPIHVARFVGDINSTQPAAILELIGPSERTGPRIRQTIFDGFPDMDPLAHLTRLVSPNVTFARQRIPPLLYGRARPVLGAVGALFLRDAFWALPLPTGPAAVLRGLWAQRVLAEMLPGPLAGISFHAPVARRGLSAAAAQSLASGSSASELAAAAHVIASIEGAAQTMAAWQAPAASGRATVRDIALALAQELAAPQQQQQQRGGGAASLWDAPHAACVLAFYEDLDSLGYVFPLTRLARLNYTEVEEEEEEEEEEETPTTGTATAANTTTAPTAASPRIKGKGKKKAAKEKSKEGGDRDKSHWKMITPLFVRLSVGSSLSPAQLAYQAHVRRLATSDPANTAVNPELRDATLAHEIAPLSGTVAMLWRDAIVAAKDRWAALLPGSGDQSPRPVLPVCEGTPLYAKWRRPKILFVVNMHWNRDVDRNVNKSRDSPHSTQNMLLQTVFQHYYNTPFDAVFVGPGATRHGILGNGQPENGFRSWASLTVAAQKYPHYEGYFLVNDDLVLVQTMFPRHHFHWRWHYPFSIGNHGLCCRPGHNWPWNGPFCPSLIKTFAQMCGDRFRGTCGGPDGLYFGQADGFYIPRSMIDEWTRWSDAMLRNGNFLEMAVPTIINALMPEGLPCTPPVLYHSAEGRMAPLALPLCTTWNYGLRWHYEDYFIGESDANAATCVAFHPIKILSSAHAQTGPRVKAYLQRRAKSDCHSAPCSGKYTLDADGFLWRWNDA